MSNNFTNKAENALNRAVKLSEERGHTYIGTEHVLLAIAEDDSTCASILLKKSKIDFNIISLLIKEISGSGTPSCLTSKDTTPKCRKLLETSYKIAKKYASEKIGTEHLLFGIIEDKECIAYKILIKTEADLSILKDNALTFLRASDSTIRYAEPIMESSIPNLIKYGRNMTALSEKGLIDPVIGRDEETERVIRILSRRNKNNPCLIGEAGVGKTAIIEGLASRIARDDVPDILRGKVIISLDLTSMVAGAKYRGDFEERIKNIMFETKRNKSIILFIDEIHTIVGAGSAEGAIDAANILKPELSRGEIQLIGATTLNEYRKYIEKDAALERRFQPVLIEEPSVESTINILYGLKTKYEIHHNVKILDEAIEAAASLSNRYIQDRYLPDKALDLLDEACALKSINTSLGSHELAESAYNTEQNVKSSSEIDLKAVLQKRNIKEKRLSSYENRQKRIFKNNVTKEDVCRVVKEITGIEISRTRGDNIYITDALSKDIIGQDEAIEKLSQALTRSFAGINSPDKPRGVFLFLGESGVGKTALAKSLAKNLFSTEEALIRFDMSEYSEPASVSKLIGSAPGYVGYDERISEIEKIRKRPYAVVLLDEVEKAHTDILSLFLQIFDHGFLTDATGRKINFRNTYIIMTSNLGSSNCGVSSDVGFVSSNNANSNFNYLKSFFKEEFINRIDEIVRFNSLSHSALKEISKNKFLLLQNRLIKNDIRINIDDSVHDHLAKISFTSGFGARPLLRVFVNEIENKIAHMIVRNELTKGSELSINIDNGKICFTTSCLLLK